MIFLVDMDVDITHQDIMTDSKIVPTYICVCPIGEIKCETLWSFICSCLGVVDGCSKLRRERNIEISSRDEYCTAGPITLCELLWSTRTPSAPPIETTFKHNFSFFSL